MTAEERRKILEEIARNEDNYPRDRIAAVRALGDMPDGPNEVDDILDRILGHPEEDSDTADAQPPRVIREVDRREARARSERVRQALVELARKNRPIVPHLARIDGLIAEMRKAARR